MLGSIILLNSNPNTFHFYKQALGYKSEVGSLQNQVDNCLWRTNHTYQKINKY